MVGGPSTIDDVSCSLNVISLPVCFEMCVCILTPNPARSAAVGLPECERKVFVRQYLETVALWPLFWVRPDSSLDEQDLSTCDVQGWVEDTVDAFSEGAKIFQDSSLPDHAANA